MIVEPSVETYAEQYSTPPTDLFERLAEETRAKTTAPHRNQHVFQRREPRKDARQLKGPPDAERIHAIWTKAANRA